MAIQILFIAIYVIISVNCKCAFGDPNGSYPAEPFMAGVIESCPYLSNSIVCCYPDQIEKMNVNFKTIDATFGGDGGGCDICGANLKRFWCEYTCNPNQADFAILLGRKNITDPLNPDHIIDAELVKLTVHPDLACSVYSSCSRTAFASQVTAMKTPGGFFMFQGEKAVTQGGQSIDIQFSSDNSLALDGISECDKQFNSIIDENGIVHQFDDYGYEIHNSCGCNTCDAACSHAATIYTSTGVFYGFDGFTVIVTWSAVVILAFVITFYRNIYQ